MFSALFPALSGFAKCRFHPNYQSFSRTSDSPEGYSRQKSGLSFGEKAEASGPRGGRQNSQNWKRKPTVGSIDDRCTKPLARPFDTCDHMMPA
jgi:hypothetical protein